MNSDEDDIVSIECLVIDMDSDEDDPGSVMPFYNSNIPSGDVAEATSGFPPVVREHRFPNAVWQQTSGPVEAGAIGTWTPQGQFIQQLPSPQIDDIRYHTQYPAAAPVTVSSYTQSGYQPAQANFLQTNGPSYQNSQAPAASPLMNGGNTPRPNTIVNGNIDYVEASPRPTEYLNGSYPDFFANTVPTNQTNLGLAEDTGTESEPKVPDEEQKLKQNTKPAPPLCDCKIDGKPVKCGVYYSHLGAAASLPELRQDLESRIGFSGGAIRIEKIRYTGKEGKTAKGCPMAKWIIRRVSLDEKILVVVKHRPGHKCQTAWIIVLLVVWEGVPQEESNELYSMLVPKLHNYGLLNNERRCATDELKTCACQGLDPRKAGASFSFGCSWSMFYNGCKFARSKDIRKFRLIDGAEVPEAEMEKGLLALVSRVTPMFKKMHPIAYRNMTLLESDEIKCRLDCEEGRAFSGVTACVDFCTHSHRDINNMNNGLTCVVSLSRHRGLSKPDDEQLHVLPLYTMDDTDEFGSREGQEIKAKTGAVEVLTKFESEVRVRFVPKKSCRRKRKEEESDCESLSSGGRRPRASSIASDASHVFDGQVQSSQISSTVVDNQGFRGWNYNSPNVDKVNWSDAETRRYTRAYTRMHLTPPPQSFSPLTTHSRTPNSKQVGEPVLTRRKKNDKSLKNVPVIPESQKLDLVGKVVEITDNKKCFEDPRIGGVAIALGHGSVLFECAKHELHATTALRNPDKSHPSRISLVFYQHRNLNLPNHGIEVWAKRLEEKQRLKDLETAPKASSSKTVK